MTKSTGATTLVPITVTDLASACSPGCKGDGCRHCYTEHELESSLYEIVEQLPCARCRNRVAVAKHNYRLCHYCATTEVLRRLQRTSLPLEGCIRCMVRFYADKDPEFALLLAAFGSDPDDD